MAGRLPNAEKEKRMRINEIATNTIFTTRADYWGLDKVTVNNIQTIIADYGLFERKSSKIREKKRADIIHKTNEFLKINDKEHRFILTWTAKYGFHTTLEITYKGLNISTIGTMDIQRRILEIKNILYKDYGVDINVDMAKYTYLEIAYTALYKDSLPKRAIDILMCLFQDQAKNYTRISPTPREKKNGNTSQTIMIKNEDAESTSNYYYLYDKSSKAKKLRNGRGLPQNYPYIIYRFEQRMHDTYFSRYFSNISVFGSSALTDLELLEYIYTHIISKALTSYCQLYVNSVDKAKEYILKMHGKSGACMKLLNDLKVKEDEDETTEILDEESFLYASPGGKNGSMKILRLITAIEKYSVEMKQIGRFRDGMCRMDGWIVEDIINDMLDAHYFALSYGLGSEKFCKGIPDPKLLMLT